MSEVIEHVDTPVVSYHKPDLPVVGQRAAAASLIEIDDQLTFQIATEFVREVKQVRDTWEAKRVQYVKPLNDTVKTINADFKQVTGDCDDAITIVDSKRGVYVRAVEAAQREEQARLDKIAREAAEAAEKAAKKLEAKQPEVAAAIRENAAVAPAAVAAPAFEKVQGSSDRRPWKATVVDLPAFVAYVSAHPEHLALLKVDQSALNKLATVYKDKMPIAGVKCEQDIVFADKRS